MRPMNSLTRADAKQHTFKGYGRSRSLTIIRKMESFFTGAVLVEDWNMGVMGVGKRRVGLGMGVMCVCRRLGDNGRRPYVVGVIMVCWSINGGL